MNIRKEIRKVINEQNEDEINKRKELAIKLLKRVSGNFVPTFKTFDNPSDEEYALEKIKSEKVANIIKTKIIPLIENGSEEDIIEAYKLVLSLHDKFFAWIGPLGIQNAVLKIYAAQKGITLQRALNILGPR